MKNLWIPLLLLLSTACNTLYTTSNSRTNATITFGSTLPDGLDEVMKVCHDPLTINATAFNPKGTCADGTGLTTSGGVAAWAVLYRAPSVNLSGIFPANLAASLDQTLLMTTPRFPVQNCEGSVNLNLIIQGVSFHDADNDWVTRDDGRPAYKLDLDPTSTSSSFAHGTIISTFQCPSVFNVLVENWLRNNAPNGLHSIFLDNVDFDVWFSFTSSGRDVSVGIETDFDFTKVHLSPELDPDFYDGTFEEFLQEYLGTTASGLKSQINNGISGALATSGLASNFESMLEGAVPAGHGICSLKERNGKLIMTTSRICGPPLPSPPPA